MSEELLLCVLSNNAMNTRKYLLLWLGLVKRGLIFMPSPFKMIIITLINQYCYLCMC